MNKSTIIKILTAVIIASFTFNNPMIIAASGGVTPRLGSDETVTLPSGNVVLATVLASGSDFTDEEKTTRNQSFLNQHSNFITISNPTMKYNCHSYAWYSQNFEDNNYWISDPLITSLNFNTPPSGYMETDGQPGDIICYVGADGHNYHSGIVVGTDANGSVIVQSKWGSYGLYEHNASDCFGAYDLGLTNISVTIKYYRPIHTHSFATRASTITNEWHEVYCLHSMCGVIIWEEHNFTYVNNGNNATHQKICADCDTTVSEAHNFIYTNNNDGETHKIICSDCGYVYGNSTHYSSLYTQADGKHSGICTSCGALFYEPHNWVYETLSGKYRCTVCNAVTDSPSVGLNDPEDSEQMAIKPDGNFIAPDLFDKRWGARHKA